MFDRGRMEIDNGLAPGTVVSQSERGQFLQQYLKHIQRN